MPPNSRKILANKFWPKQKKRNKENPKILKCTTPLQRNQLNTNKQVRRLHLENREHRRMAAPARLLA